MAIKQAPGVLAAEVDYETATARIGTEPGETVPREAIMAELKKIGYSGEFVE